MVKKILVLLAGTLVTLAAYAAGAQLRDGHPDRYTVQRGDTLWSISAKFLAKPWLWPEIWQANPQVHNPHLIYPGDVLNLSFLGQGGQSEPTLTLHPAVHREGNAVPAIPLKDVETFLKDLRVMDSAAVKSAPYVVGLEESRLRGTVGQNVYVRGLGGEAGQRWAVARPTHMFRTFSSPGPGDDMVAHTLDANVALGATPWRENRRNDGHWEAGKDAGVEVTIIGTVETLRMGDPATVLLLDSTREIRAGDRLVPIDATPYDPYYYPHPPKSVADGARVIGLADALATSGPDQVVLLSVGARDGVDNGTTFQMDEPGERIHDDVASTSMRRIGGQHVTLPDEYVGHVMVFRTFDRVSYGLVMDGLRPVHIGAKLRLPE